VNEEDAERDRATQVYLDVGFESESKNDNGGDSHRRHAIASPGGPRADFARCVNSWQHRQDRQSA